MYRCMCGSRPLIKRTETGFFSTGVSITSHIGGVLGGILFGVLLSKKGYTRG